MAKSKDFSRTFEEAAKAAALAGREHEEASEEEKARRAKNGNTQGKKGCKVMRINMGFTSDNYEFIKIMSKVSGRTMTELVNALIENYRRQHPDMMDEAKAALDSIGFDLFED